MGLGASVASEWRSADQRSRRAALIGLGSVLTTGIPVVGLLLGCLALVVTSRARRAATAPVEAEPEWTAPVPRVATFGFLLALLATLLGLLFTTAFVGLVLLG